MTLNLFKTIQRFRKNRKGFSLIEISVVILIIGVLIAGISQASDMIDEAALKGARTASKGSRVGRIRDLVLWLDAVSDGGSLTATSKQAVDGDPVTQLKDLNPRSSAKFTLAGTSTFSSNKVSGLPGLNLNGESNFFKLNDRFDNSTGEYTIYLVYQPVVIPTATTVILEKRSATGTVFPYKLELESTGFYKLSDNTGSVYGAKKASAGKVNVIALTRSALTLGIEVDDVYKSDTGGTGVNSDELIIGAQNAAPLAVFNKGRIGELIIYERNLVASEKDDIELYLFKKWKIEKDATKAGVCSTSAVANSVGTMAVGASSFSCLPGYTYTQPAAAPGCSGAPNLAFTNTGSATCAQSHCFVPANLKVTQTMVLPGTGISLTCKNGGTNPSNCTCSSSGWGITCAVAGVCT
jgi:prepilin-type N-terminal cleavage/methylation domain-containing protein